MRSAAASALVCLAVLAFGVGKVRPQEAQRPETGSLTVGLRPVAEGLISPVHIAVPADGTGRRFVVDQAGVVRILTREGQLLEEPFLDVRDRMVELRADFDERGLLGLAFHPQYASNGRFFVYYSAPRRAGAPGGWDHTTHIAEYRASSDPNRTDPATERILLQVDQPQFNHNAGAIAFGPDGFLYIALGDGGGANDVGGGHPPQGNGQDTSTLLGSILRIDVDRGDPYEIPVDNPFADGEGGRAEIFAYGFRNPYGMAFESAGEQRLFVADAGQNLWEEVSIVTAGGNYGWNIKEGTHCFNPREPSVSLPSCPSTGARGEPLRDPVIELARTEENGITIVRGVLYQGDAIPELRGRYLFATWSRDFRNPSGILYAAAPPDGAEGLWEVQRLRVTGLGGATEDHLGRFVQAVGEDGERELYVLTSRSAAPRGQSGEVFQIVPVQPSEPAPAGISPWWWVFIGAAGILVILLIVAFRRPRPAAG